MMHRFYFHTTCRWCCCLILIFIAGCVAAQNSDSVFTSNRSLDSSNQDIENGKNNFTDVNVDDISPVVVRKIDNKKIDKLRKDKAFWYVNEKPLREKPKAETRPALTKLFGSPWFKALLWCIMIASLIAIIIWFLRASNVKLFSQRKTAVNELHDDIEQENIFAINFDENIASAIAVKDFRSAIRLMYLQLLVTMDQKNLISYKQQKTNSDYLFQLSDTSFYKPFFNLTRTFEYSWYGQFAINEARFASISKDFSLFKNLVTN